MTDECLDYNRMAAATETLLILGSEDFYSGPSELCFLIQILRSWYWDKTVP